ncbi:MAG: hypothetical protein PHU35_01145 [Bacteroidales bacterium]|nr:hypothetical protein [Bacteroidales bacterium]
MAKIAKRNIEYYNQACSTLSPALLYTLNNPARYPNNPISPF